MGLGWRLSRTLGTPMPCVAPESMWIIQAQRAFADCFPGPIELLAVVVIFWLLAQYLAESVLFLCGGDSSPTVWYNGASWRGI